MARKERQEALQMLRDRGLRVSVPDRGDFKPTKPTVKELFDLLRLLILSLARLPRGHGHAGLDRQIPSGFAHI
jgi:hypothetical protein